MEISLALEMVQFQNLLQTVMKLITLEFLVEWKF